MTRQWHVLTATLAIGLLSAAAGAEEASVTGELEILHEDDFLHGRARHVFLVHDLASGEFFELLFESRPPAGLRSGDRVSVRGRAEGRAIAITDLTVDARAGGGGDAGTGDAGAPSGTRSAVVMIVDFDADGDGAADLLAAPHDPAAVEDYMFSGVPYNNGGLVELRSVRGLYETSSLNGMTFTGSVLAPITL